MVCHDTTGTYKKFPAGCGHPAYEEKKMGKKVFIPVDLRNVARHVGRTSRKTCGTCHFYGGGGDGVKHGDLDSSLLTADKNLDVHMDAGGLNFGCTRCHTTMAHRIAGRFYSSPSTDRYRLALPDDDGSRIACESCHSRRPHRTNRKLNDHTDRIACETCHIPALARVNPTKMWWDWSKAGRFDENGRMIVKKDDKGRIIYHTKKGEMRWATNVMPEYEWFNGVITHVLLSDRIDDSRPVRLTQIHGSCSDPASRIYPFKKFRGKQPYDPVNKTMVVPRLFGKKGTGAYWAEFDWLKSVKAGMDAAGAPFSGKVGFVETEYLRPVAHMVAPGKDALSCDECHVEKGRLEKLRGFYMPGRDRNRVLDTTGWAVVGIALMGILIHGLMRIITRSEGRRRK